jgi:hypothetical protein
MSIGNIKNEITFLGTKGRRVNSELEEQYCFIEYRGKPVCLLCNGSVSAVPKKSNVERHL